MCVTYLTALNFLIAINSLTRHVSALTRQL